MSTRSLSSTFKFPREPHWAGDLLKRGFDILVSLAVLILLAPLFGLIALAIRRDSPGPAFYRGPRLGRRGMVFRMLKFRTMWEAPESYAGPRLTAHDDARITSLGRWLRDTKLNELPQFWNVLKGEMSLVGPRPEDPELAKTWPTGMGKEILSVRPGITSPASVQYRDEERLLSAGSLLQKYILDLGPNKMRLDQIYVRHRSFLLDLDVLLWTALMMLPKVRAQTPPEALLFVGPVTRLIRRYMSWFSIDLVITFLSIGMAGLIWRMSGPLNVGWPRAVLLAVGFALLFSGTGAMLGANRISWSKAAFTDIFDLLPGWMLATAIACAVNWGMGDFPLALVLAAAGLALGGFVFARYRTRLVIGLLSRTLGSHSQARAVRERVLILGSGQNAQLAAWLFQHPTNLSRFRLVGFVDDDPFKQGTRIYGAHVLGTCKDLCQVVQKHDVGLVILADEDLAQRQYRAILEGCRQAVVRLVFIPDMLAWLHDWLAPAMPGGGDPRRAAAPQAGTPEAEDGLPCLPCLRCMARGALERMIPPWEAAGPAPGGVKTGD